MRTLSFGSLWMRALVCLLTLLVVGAALPPAVARAETDPGVHDPSIIKQGDYYYFFSTGDAGSNNELPIQRSRDLVNWEVVGAVWNTVPQWLVDEIGRYPDDLWAPDVSFYAGNPGTPDDDEYRVYYAISIFGTNRSVIALATNKTLDPASPNYRWVDEGAVIRSTSSDFWNAIDPNLVITPSGEYWLAFGSFWGGLKMRRIDPATGKLSASDTTLYDLSSRPNWAVEGPSVIYRNGYYYLFVSFDYCCRGADSNYRTMVGRATQVTGPYVDQAGVPMTAEGGTEVLKGYDRYRGTGHGYAFWDGANAYFAHHYYDSLEGGRPRLQVRPLTWDAQSWPVLGEPLGEQEGGAYVTLVNRNSGKCVEVANSATSDGANVQQSTCTNAPNQQWRLEPVGGYYRIVNRNSGKVLEIAGNSTANGASAQQGAWLSKASQQFRFTPTTNGWSVIENRNSGKVVDIAGCSTADGAKVGQWSRNGLTCQDFRVQPVGTTVLVNRNSGRVLEVAGMGTFNGANVAQWEWLNNAGQRWSFNHTTDGYYRLVNANSGKVLEVAGCRLEDGANVAQWTANGFPCQEFRLAPLNDGSYRLVNRNSGKVVEVASCGLEDGANVVQWAANGFPCQQWSLWNVATTTN